MQPKIGIFDSGVGGLSVLAACVRRFPACYYYLGDNGRAPYGSRPKEEIAAFTYEALLRFAGKGADAAVIACNTATSACLPSMREQFSFPILGTEPAVRLAARTKRNVLVLCTPHTASGERLASLLDACPGCAFTVFAPPRLAAAVEDLLLRGIPLSLREHLPAGEFDGVVLGCTHYAFLKKEIAAFYRAPVFDGAEGIARRLASLFPDARMESKWSEKDSANKSLTNFDPPVVRFLGDFARANEKVFKQTFDFCGFWGEAENS